MQGGCLMDNTENKSIDNAINAWLLKCEKLKEVAELIHTEELPDETETLALQRSGVEKLPLR